MRCVSRYVFVLVIILSAVAARAATYKCSAGYYLNDAGECTLCNPGATPYYCPGDDMRHACPTTDTDYNQFGYIRVSGKENNWANIPSTKASDCMCDLDFRDEYGNLFLLENRFNGQNYWGNRRWWYKAVSGFYLADYSWTSSYHWYNSLKTCTNAPAHAHYTGAGTPDEPKSGGARDYNDCPWVCDAGWGRSGDECVELCASGISRINIAGHSFNIYPAARTTPALGINYNGRTCYVSMAPGSANNAINIKYNGQTFHTVN